MHPPQKKSSHKKKPPPVKATSGSPMVTTTTQVPSKPQTRVVPAVTTNASSVESNTSTVTSGSNSTTVITSTKAEADALPSQDSAVQSSVVPPSQPTKVKIFLHWISNPIEILTDSDLAQLICYEMKKFRKQN